MAPKGVDSKPGHAHMEEGFSKVLRVVESIES